MNQDPLIIAFVQGAQWWEYQQAHATMWPTDRNLAEHIASQRAFAGTLGKYQPNEPAPMTIPTTPTTPQPNNEDAQEILRAKLCRRTGVAVSVADCAAIVQAEYRYWSVAEIDAAIGGTGASANILCAINGFRAPWHPDPLPTVPTGHAAAQIVDSVKLARLTIAAKAVLAFADRTGCSNDLHEDLRAALKDNQP